MTYPASMERGLPGTGISSVEVAYKKSSSGSAVPGGTWLNEIPSLNKGEYLWTRTKTTLTTGESTSAFTVSYQGTDGNSGKDGLNGKDGNSGNGVTSSSINYATSSSAESPPSAGWSQSLPAVSQGQYLWIRTDTNFTDGSSTRAYNLGYVAMDGKAGKDGANGNDGNPGVGISTAAVSYQLSPTGSNPPTGTWSATIPTVIKGQFLWSRIIFTLTDNRVSTAYSVAYHAIDGEPGKAGNAGPANNLSIGSVTTGAAGVSITGTAPSQVLNFTLPAGSQGNNGISYTPQTPSPRTVSVATPYQHTDTTKPFKVIVNARATSSVTLVALGQTDRVELKIGPTAASVALNANGGYVMGVWETGITGISVTVGTSLQDGGQLSADVPAGWYFSINRQAGTAATIVSCFTQSLTP